MSISSTSSRAFWSVLCCVVVIAACGGSEGSSSGEDANNGGTTDGTTGGTTNGTTETSNGTGVTSNGTMGTSNGTTGGTTSFVGVGLSVDNAEARACELVVEDPEGALGDVAFDDAVLGRFIKRGPRTAMAFVPRSDTAFADGAVMLQMLEGASPDGLSILTSACYDRDGNPIDAVLTILR